MAVPTPEFTFVVENDNYLGFIRDIVQPEVEKHCNPKRPEVVRPVLPPEQHPPRLWFFIHLRTKSKSLTLAIRMDNLYLVGFKTSDGPFPEVWWEFNNDDNTHLISDANWLGFGGSYLDLVGKGGLERIDVGRGRMSDAVQVLAKYNPPKTTDMMILEEEEEEDPYAEPKRMLASLVLMLCEGLRFLSVSCTVENTFIDWTVGNITNIEAIQVNNWGKISTAIQTGDFTYVKDLNIGINNVDDANKIIALVKKKNRQSSTGENMDDLL